MPFRSELFAGRFGRVARQRVSPKYVIRFNNIMANFVITFIEVRHGKKLFFCLYTEDKLADVDCSMGKFFYLLVVDCIPSVEEQSNLAVTSELLHLFVVKA